MARETNIRSISRERLYQELRANPQNAVHKQRSGYVTSTLRLDSASTPNSVRTQRDVVSNQRMVFLPAVHSGRASHP